MGTGGLTREHFDARWNSRLQSFQSFAQSPKQEAFEPQSAYKGHQVCGMGTFLVEEQPLAEEPMVKEMWKNFGRTWQHKETLLDASIKGRISKNLLLLPSFYKAPSFYPWRKKQELRRSFAVVGILRQDLRLLVLLAGEVSLRRVSSFFLVCLCFSCRFSLFFSLCFSAFVFVQ